MHHSHQFRQSEVNCLGILLVSGISLIISVGIISNVLHSDGESARLRERYCFEIPHVAQSGFITIFVYEYVMVQILSHISLRITLSILLASFLQLLLDHATIILAQDKLTLGYIVIRDDKAFFFTFFLKNLFDFIIFRIIILIVFVNIFPILLIPFFFRVHFVVNKSFIF